MSYVYHLAIVVASLVSFVSACPGLQHRFQRNHYIGLDTGPRIIRPLQWGDVQIIHTTDIHGWYQGHTKKTSPEPNYSADWGDFASFVHHMRQKAKERGVDLLVVDSGDLHDGAGLTDGFPANQGPDAHVANEIHSMIKFDLLAVGNHELYKYDNALDTFQNFVPQQNGRYISSNVNITHVNSEGVSVSEPMGEQYVKFKTSLGRKVTSIGVLFNFHNQDRNLTVQPPAEMVKESWFQEAIKEEPDFFLLNGHMPVRNDDWPVVIQAIRTVHATVPLVVTGGHTHIRDCFIFDSNAFSIESGRYLETIGWLSFNLTGNTSTTPFSRSYIDANRRNYAYHVGLEDPSHLSTPQGHKITSEMNRVAQAWNLTEVYGTAPRDYYLSRVPPTSDSSLLKLLASEVLPTVISGSNPDRIDIPNIVVVNTGSQRFDIYAGTFTKNDVYIVSPFINHFVYFSNVPYKYAVHLVDILNRNGESISNYYREDDAKVVSIYSINAQQAFQIQGRSKDRQTTLGYVTKDSCPGIGDDTEHLPVPHVHIPDFVASPVSNNKTAISIDDNIDIIVIDFVAKDVVIALNTLQKDHVYQIGEAKRYNDLNTQDLYRLYAQKAWNRTM